MTNNEKAIRKAHSDFRETFLVSKKKQWIEIRKGQKVDRANAIIDLVHSGIDIKDAQDIVDREIEHDKFNFRIDAVNELRRKKRELEKELKVKTHYNAL